MQVRRTRWTKRLPLNTWSYPEMKHRPLHPFQALTISFLFVISLFCPSLTDVASFDWGHFLWKTSESELDVRLWKVLSFIFEGQEFKFEESLNETRVFRVLGFLLGIVAKTHLIHKCIKLFWESRFFQKIFLLILEFCQELGCLVVRGFFDTFVQILRCLLSKVKCTLKGVEAFNPAFDV